MKRLWRSLINAGITEDLLPSRQGVIRTVNFSALMACIMLWFFAVCNVFIPTPPLIRLAIIEAIVGALLPLFIILNHRKHYHTATFLLFIALHIFIGIVTFFLAPGQMLEFVHVVFIVSALMIYGWRWPFFAFYLLNVLMFYGPQLLLNVYPEGVFHYRDPIATLIPVVFVLKHFLSERDAYEAQLANQNKQLQRLSKEKDQLISIAAHDLKSPLNRIEGLLSVVKLSSDNLTAEQHELIDKVSEVSKGAKCPDPGHS